MEPKAGLFQVLNSSHSPNFSKPSRPTTVTSNSPTAFSNPLDKSKPRSSSNRRSRLQIPSESDHVQLRDLPLFASKTPHPYQNSLASPTQFQTYSTFESHESPYIKATDSQEVFLRSQGKSLDNVSKPQQNLNIPNEKENFILVRKEAQSPKMFGSEHLKPVKSVSGQKITGLFASKMFPMTDVKGKLNLKFFLKPSLRSSATMEFRPNQTGFGSSPVHDGHNFLSLQRQSSLETFYSSNQQAENMVRKIIERPKRVPTQSSNLLIEQTPSKIQKEEKAWGVQKIIIQKKMPCVRLSTTPSRAITRNESRQQFRTIENISEDRHIEERKFIEDNNEALDDLLTICTKKKGEHYEKARDKQLRTQELGRKSATPTPVPRLARRKINILREDGNFSRAEVSPTHHNQSSPTHPVFLAPPSAEVKKIQRYADTATDLNGFTEWEAMTVNPNSERQELIDLNTASRGLSTDEEEAPKEKKKGLRKKDKMVNKSGHKEDKERRHLPPKKVEEYRNYIMGLNFTFNVVIKQDKENHGMYKYYVGKGNNYELIRFLMKQRWWWAQTDSKTSPDLNFMWTQLGNNKFITSLKSKKKPMLLDKGSPVRAKTNPLKINVNSTASHESDLESEMDSKNQVVKLPAEMSKSKLHKKKEGNKHEADKKTTHNPTILQKIFTNTEIDMIDSYIAFNYKNKSIKGLGFEDWEELCRLRKSPAMQVINDTNALRMCNHLEKNFHLANKKALLWNMRSYYEALKDNVFQHLPLTFHIKTGPEDDEFKKFLEYYHQRENEMQEEAKIVSEPKHRKIKNIWIVKPGEETNRGFGISVCSDLAQIQEIVSTIKKPEGTEIDRTYLIQQYIDRPFLYNRRKFDLRCYTLLSCINNSMKGYWYQEGYIRTSSKEFSVKNLANKQVHLTNNAVQKKSEDYGKYESGNKLTFSEFQKYLERHHHGTSFDQHIYPQIRSLAIDTMRAVFDRIDPNRRENCFEIFGLDFMIDSDLKVWLIEVNTNPDITTDSPILAKIIPGMVDNALRLTLDQMYPPPATINRKPPLAENLLENNKFELVFDEIEEAPELRKVLKTHNQTLDMIFDIEVEGDQDSIEEVKD